MSLKNNFNVITYFPHTAKCVFLVWNVLTTAHHLMTFRPRIPQTGSTRSSSIITEIYVHGPK